MRYSTTISSTSIFLLPLIFGNAALAELLGCDAVNCPVDEYRTAQCQVGNATLKALGIGNFTTTMDTRPITWTLGLQESNIAANGSQSTLALDRNFYLGTPPSLQLNNTTGCALFFEGIAANITVPNVGNQGNITCSDALNQNCVSDLITQAQAAGEDISDSDFCGALHDSLVNKPPATCNGVKGSWGAIAVRSLDDLQKIEQSQCRPTTGLGYDLSLVESQRQLPASRDVKEMGPIINAVTPVMTVFRKGNDTTADLTCLKLVQSTANQTTDTSTKSSVSSASCINTLAMASLALVSSIFVAAF